MTALHIFDMDGTLLSGTTASLQIAAAHGSESELRALEARFTAGALDTAGFAAAIHGLWANLIPEIVAAAVDGGTWLTEELRGDLPVSRCVAYGDSLSDAPLFAHLTATVAVNADHHLENRATASYRGRSLLEAYVLGRAHLGAAHPPSQS
ncbi:hypothetical protein [Actinoplanes sp. NPDC051411]|uniref:hypothetical protein n=1 Tax=Actinoplanes sp. NPDC051411 TaxID=3155522 RepID=UPI00341E75A3